MASRLYTTLGLSSTTDTNSVIIKIVLSYEDIIYGIVFSQILFIPYKEELLIMSSLEYLELKMNGLFHRRPRTVTRIFI